MNRFLTLGTLWLGTLALAASLIPGPDRSRQGAERIATAIPTTVLLGAIRVPAAVVAARLGAAETEPAQDDPSAAKAAKNEKNPTRKAKAKVDKVKKSDDEWRAELTPEQYQVTRCSATERPFTGKYWNHHETGTYVCVGCRQELFSSDTKFESGSGWPSYFQPVNKHAVTEKKDISLGMMRTEVLCSRCEAHLGHVFEDGPRPTGLRFCINSAALDFRPAGGAGQEDAAQAAK